MATTESTQKADAPTEFAVADSERQWLAVLGRGDEPADGVEDYCSYLSQGLGRNAVQLRQIRVRWNDDGWLAALRSLWAESAIRTSSWALLQYTTLAWSRRGLPFGAWVVLKLLRWRGLRCAVVFHEATRQTGDRWIDHLRGACQHWVIQRLYSGANVGIFLDPLDKIRWLPRNARKAVFIPIGANIPANDPDDSDSHEHTDGTKTVAVFCLSDPPNRQRELADIAHAMKAVARQGVKARVVFLGRGTENARKEIDGIFDSTNVQAVTLGLQSAHEIKRILSDADVMLCVRGPLYMRRGSAIAGIACGLPIVAYAGEAEGTPLEEAGIELVPYLDREALGTALAHVLTDVRVLSDLRRRSVTAQKHYFSWDAIANQMAETLGVTPKRAVA
ncbi:MAG: hypothetical protein ACRD8A_01450 [Candidatus Acidiferrales bacterium]